MVVHGRRINHMGSFCRPPRTILRPLLGVLLLLVLSILALAATVRYEYDDSDRLVRVEYMTALSPSTPTMRSGTG